MLKSEEVIWKKERKKKERKKDAEISGSHSEERKKERL